MPLQEISAAVTSIKAAIDITKGIKAVVRKAEVNNQLSDLLERLLAVQSLTLSLQADHQSLIQEKDDLRHRLMEFENWNQTESEYQLTEICPGTLVYAYKKPPDSPQPEHWLCTNCWAARKKSILQKKRARIYVCPSCKTEIINMNEPPEPPLQIRSIPVRF